jgi:hypothetical protein
MWAVAGVILASILVGVLGSIAVGQWLKITRLEGRIQGFGQQLRNIPKRKSDRVSDH